MAIEKQIWTDVILECLVPDTSFLAESVDMSAMVENNTINLAEAGIEPEVLVNNATYPIAVTTREDVPIALPLHTFDTVSTVVRNVEEKETAYNKMESVTAGHKRALQRKNGAMALQNWAPAANTPYSKVNIATGANSIGGYKKITFAGILSMESFFRGLDVNMDSLVCVLHPNHLADLQEEDIKLYSEVIKSNKIFSFKLYSSSQTPIYNTTTKTKKAMGAIAEATDGISSVFWCNKEVMRAIGNIDIFAKYADPDLRGDVIGFQERFTALQLRNKYTGAITSPKNA